MRSRLSVAVVLASFALLPGSVGLARAPMTDAQVRQAIIKQSIADYGGSCPCPFNKAKNGSNCGGRSAYSRRGGSPPFCYAKDVTNSMVADWRRNNP
jgi:hypothetical protein